MKFTPSEARPQEDGHFHFLSSWIPEPPCKGGLATQPERALGEEGSDNTNYETCEGY